MATTNTLTGLVPTIYEAMDVVSREQIGLIPAVTLDASASGAAVGQTVSIPVTAAHAAETITAASTVPTSGGQTIAPTTMSISSAYAVPFLWTGEDERSVSGSGPGAQRMRADQIAQALRTLSNAVEADLAALYKTFSRATGTAGTTPFASTLNDSAQVLKILLDNGAPTGDLNMVVNTTAGANLRTLAQLTKANEAASSDTLRRGVLLDVHGFRIRESAQIKAHTKGTGATYNADLVAGYAVGDTAIHVEAGTGTILAGDVITWTGDTNKYLVTTGFAGDGDGDIVIGANGLRATLANDVAMTIGANYTANMAFARNALVLLARPPARPLGGDLADDVMLVTDPYSGITYSFATYGGYHQRRWQVELVWGVKNIKPEHTAILLG